MGRIKDIVGQRFGRLTAVRFVGVSEKGAAEWECKCDCGNTVVVQGTSLRYGTTQSCGCLHRDVSSNDLTGMRFGRLTVVKRAPYKKHGYIVWECVCDCGNTTEVMSSSLRQGNTQSCGCLSREIAAKQETTHGMSRTRIYKEWLSIKQRTLNPNDSAYQRYYGGVGKGICERWANSFENFYEDMKEGYADNLTIDRIDNSKGYEPSNCRWITHKAQQNNKTTNVLVTHNGKTQTIAEWCDELGLSRNMVYQRKKNGWSDEELFLPPYTWRSKKNR